MQRYEEIINAKHVQQIAAHEQAFGKLGELQTESQKKALKRTLAPITVGRPVVK